METTVQQPLPLSLNKRSGGRGGGGGGGGGGGARGRGDEEGCGFEVQYMVVTASKPLVA